MSADLMQIVIVGPAVCLPKHAFFFSFSAKSVLSLQVTGGAYTPFLKHDYMVKRSKKLSLRGITF